MPDRRARVLLGIGRVEIDAPGLDAEPAAVGHRIARVEDQVEQHLLDPAQVGEREQLPGLEIELELDGLADGHAQHPLRGPDRGVEIEAAGLDQVPPGKGQQLAGERRGAGGGIGDRLHVLPPRVAGRQRLRHEFAVAEDRHQHVVEVVSHAPSQPTDGLEPLRLPETFVAGPPGGLDLLQVFNIHRASHPAGHPALLVLDRHHPGQHPAVDAVAPAIADLHLERRASLGRGGPAPLDLGQLVGVVEPGLAVRVQVLAARARELLPGPIHVLVAPVGADGPDEARGDVAQGPVQLLGLAEGGERALLGGDVGGHAEDFVAAAVLVHQRHLDRAEPADLPIRVGDLLFGDELHAPGPHDLAVVVDEVAHLAGIGVEIGVGLADHAINRRPVAAGQRLVRQHEASIPVLHEHHARLGIDDPAEEGTLLLQDGLDPLLFGEGPGLGGPASAELHLRHHLAGQHAQQVRLVRRELPRHVVEDREGPHDEAVGRHQRRARVEPDSWRPHHIRIGGEASVLQGIRDHEDVGELLGVGAERALPGGLAEAQAQLGLEPLAVVILEGDQRDGGGTDPGGDAGDVVVRLFGWGVQQIVPAERGHALRFICMGGSGGGGGGGLVHWSGCWHVHDLSGGPAT